jgi:protoporphyrinogen oxidase
MLSINRLTRILFLGKLFSYPISLNIKTALNLGPVRIVKILFSYLKIRLFPIKDEKSLGDFYVNRFGRELYDTFFKEYTEKVWGIDPKNISKDWGAQRVKGISIRKVIMNALGMAKDGETSLIDRFKYPKMGAGQIYDILAERVKERGVDIRLGKRVLAIKTENKRAVAIDILDAITNKTENIRVDFLISTMPVKDLVEALGQTVPMKVASVAKGLLYRDMVVAGLLLKKMKMLNGDGAKTYNGIIPDNWLYIQEPGLSVGRLSIGNNFSPFMLGSDREISLYAEYFCDEGDETWLKDDEMIADFAANELASIGLIDESDILEKKVVRVKKAYPAYFGAYADFGKVREYLDSFENLFLIGRNGMHKYNNMDHSILTGLAAAENILKGDKNKDNIWAINTEEEYVESGKAR